MKKFLIILLVSFILTLPTHAQTPEAMPATETANLSYTAPEVMLLPNHPLYKLQLVWDRIMYVFTTDPYARANKFISLADRELTGAVKIIETGDLEVGVHSAFRGEHYMTMFVNTMKAASYDTGNLNTEIINRAHAAYPYHKQIITQMIQKSSGDSQNKLRQILEFSQRNDNELKLLEQEYKITP